MENVKLSRSYTSFILGLFFSICTPLANAAGGYPGLVCDDLTIKDVSVTAIQSDAYHGYTYVELFGKKKEGDTKKTKFGGFVYYGGANYTYSISDMMKMATIAYFTGLSVDVCFYESAIYKSSIRAMEFSKKTNVPSW
ncbi:hypothetical protein [Serratia liquefaciens]|uniref:hypothetical protein n=1 Tax=Serratia liquefaciens TaxID=614 RepID=UPI00382D29BE